MAIAETRLAEEHARLLKRALQEPGVREVMDLYQAWQRLDEIAEHDRQAMTPVTVQWLSDSSASLEPQE